MSKQIKKINTGNEKQCINSDAAVILLESPAEFFYKYIIYGNK